jgi:hypothetical protein
MVQLMRALAEESHAPESKPKGPKTAGETSEATGHPSQTKTTSSPSESAPRSPYVARRASLPSQRRAHPEPDQVVLRGWLVKLGSIVKNWKKRYMV